VKALMLIFVCAYSQRAVNVIFAQSQMTVGDWGQLENLRKSQTIAHDYMDGVPLFDYIERYSNICRLILDFSTCHFPTEINFVPEAVSSRADYIPGKNGHDGIHHIRIHLPSQKLYMPSERGSTLIFRLARTVKFPNLREAHIAMTLSEARLDTRDEATPTSTNQDVCLRFFDCVGHVAASWKSLEVIAVCARIILQADDERRDVWHLWVSGQG
jgi:hypothetical protein